MKKSNTMISDWLNEYGTKESDRFVENNLFITEKVFNTLDEKKITIQDLSFKMGLHVQQINDMLTGLYNFTLKDIVKLEIALDIKII